MAQLVLDKLDLQILKLMQAHGKLSNQELAEKVGLSASPCSRRVKALEEAGYIAGYATLLNPEHFNLVLTAYVQVRLDKHSGEVLDNFEAKMASYDEVQECCLLTGSDFDYQLKVLIRDMPEYKVFLLDKLTSIEHVSGVRSSFVLKQVKNQTRIPLPHDLP
ncbi:MAG: Lrp/AsnC family transcriptional regulator [Shewanella sp.]|uniref:Lrp/AsnC family transcriptional regulator n=1 Tax=Shewanella sp. SNU WT4 TaxID=2590015 RepID=UPI00112A6DCB|nr:Lrp/AsnC family transcriptional regulator [Shewanella sp. SNU WT4]QDF65738.1 Lrp/AsnC family transcriptional regulator [Shewanella sp. SNU WT4]